MAAYLNMDIYNLPMGLKSLLHWDGSRTVLTNSQLAEY